MENSNNEMYFRFCRSRRSVRIQTLQSSSKTAPKWTSVEEGYLMEGVFTRGENSWEEIISHFDFHPVFCLLFSFFPSQQCDSGLVVFLMF